MINFYKVKNNVSGSSKNIDSILSTGWINRNDWANIPNDPFATDWNDIQEYYHVQSNSFGGGHPDIELKELNFPINNPTRLFMELPVPIDRSDLVGNRPIQIKDETENLQMTRVTTKPNDNEYRIPLDNSLRQDVIEINKSKLKHKISFDYYGLHQVPTQPFMIHENYGNEIIHFPKGTKIFNSKEILKIQKKMLVDIEKKRIKNRNKYKGIKFYENTTN